MHTIISPHSVVVKETAHSRSSALFTDSFITACKKCLDLQLHYSYLEQLRTTSVICMYMQICDLVELWTLGSFYVNYNVSSLSCVIVVCVKSAYVCVPFLQLFIYLELYFFFIVIFYLWMSVSVTRKQYLEKAFRLSSASIAMKVAMTPME